MHWQLNRIQYPVYNLGPGKRIGIWTQGCSLKCPDCVNQSLWRSDGGRLVPVDLLLENILQLAGDYDGITISGGEPFDQYEPLIAFCSYIKLKTSLDIFVYSGYSLEEIRRDHQDCLYANCMDYLLDGRYVQPLNRNESLRGSANQRLYRFIDGKQNEIQPIQEDQRWSVYISQENEIFLTGIPRKDEMRSLQYELTRAGIKTEFT